MLKAAMRIMERKGLTNFTMEEVAEEANVTKVTLYTYFTSKENLIMAVSHNVHEQIHDIIANVINEHVSYNGLETCMHIKDAVLSFLTELPFRCNMIMESISIYNMPPEKLSKAMSSSPFRIKINEKTKVLANLIFSQFDKGRKDGSIRKDTTNEILMAYLWNCISGFITITSTPVFQTDELQTFLHQTTEFHEKFARVLLSRKN